MAVLIAGSGSEIKEFAVRAGADSLAVAPFPAEFSQKNCALLSWLRPAIRRFCVTTISKSNSNPHYTMNTTVTSLCAILFLGAFNILQAGEPPKAKTGSPEFERMKSLVGTWTGKADMGQGPIDMTIQYRLIAAGSVLEERCFVGTPNEMVSMYYDKNGKLAMTHYCIMGNRPEMALKSSDAKSITFDLDAACCAFDAKKESHMHGITIRFDGPDTITTSCKAIIDGKEAPEHATVLKRVKEKKPAAN
jgi:hypothetical protein